MIRVLDIESRSIAHDLEILPDAKLISINGRAINDILDYRFHSSAENLEVLIEQKGKRTIFEIKKDYQDDLGFVLEDLRMHKCGNNCIFCFVHQNPKGLRKSLYVKDEDYRFSLCFCFHRTQD